MGHKPDQKRRAARAAKEAARVKPVPKRDETPTAPPDAPGDPYFATRMRRKAEEARTRLGAEKGVNAWVAEESALVIGLCRAGVEAKSAIGQFEDHEIWVLGDQAEALIYEAARRIQNGLRSLGLEVEHSIVVTEGYYIFHCRW